MTNVSKHQEWNAERLEDWLITHIANMLNKSVDDIDPDMPFNSMGLDSVYAMDLIVELENLLGMEIESTIVWDYPTVRLLCEYVATLLNETSALK